MSLRNTCVAAALALTLTAPAAFAQQAANDHPGSAGERTTTPTQSTMGHGMMGQGGMCGGMGQMGMMSASASHVEGRIAFLKAELKITDAQLPLWNATAEAMRANAKNMVETCTTMMNRNQAAKLPDRLAAREKMLTAHLDAVRKLKAAIDPLYAALSDEQKKTADQIMPGMGSGMDMGMRMGMGPAGTKTP